MANRSSRGSQLKRRERIRERDWFCGAQRRWALKAIPLLLFKKRCLARPTEKCLLHAAERRI